MGIGVAGYRRGQISMADQGTGDGSAGVQLVQRPARRLNQDYNNIWVNHNDLAVTEPW